jgi:LPS export ABC transporter protein LptC
MPEFLAKRLRPLLLVGIVGFTITEIVALSPASVEQEDPAANTPIDPQALVPDSDGNLATGIPKDRIPEYQVERFDYVSTEKGVKQWNLLADQAAMYSKEKLVHAFKVKANLFDPDDKITVITGKEAKYFMNERDVEIFGDVVAVFPDGFELHSAYLRYRPNVRQIDIPETYHVTGGSKTANGQDMRFESEGFHYKMAISEILLPKNVHLTLDRPGQPDDSTLIESDHSVIHRDRQSADFTMIPTRPISERFVHITQPTLFTRSRTATLNYGDSANLLKYLVAYDDVLIKQIADEKKDEKKKKPPPEYPPAKPEPLLKYATAGQADFDNHSNLIILTRFPQVYQDRDTVTGDIIKMHRDTDIIEAENSNSFSEGDQPKPSPKPLEKPVLVQ